MNLSLATMVHRLRRRRARTPEKPLRDELLSIERLEERAKALAARLTVDPAPRGNARDLFPRRCGDPAAGHVDSLGRAPGGQGFRSPP